jgi:2,5-diketo-D-gluconate reductase A
LADKYGKTPVQIILRFEVQEGVAVLPKSTNPAHMAGNLDLFDFRLADDEMKEIRRAGYRQRAAMILTSRAWVKCC